MTSDLMIGLILSQLDYYGTPHFMVLWGGEERLVEDGRDLEVIDEAG